MSDEAAFLEALKANPADDTARLVYADWLDEHNEPQKAEYLRLLVSFAQREGNLASACDHEALVKAGKGLSPTWRVATSLRFSLVLCSYDDQFRAIILIRKLNGDGLSEAKDASENLPCLILSSVTFERAWATMKDAMRVGKFDLRIVPTDPEHPDGSASYELVAHCSTPRGTTSDTSEAGAALVKFLTEVLNLSGEEAARRAVLNSPIVYRSGLTRQQARTERAAVGGTLPPYNHQRGWWLTVTYRRRPEGRA